MIWDATTIRWAKRWRETGSFEAKSNKGKSRSPLKKHEEWLLTLVRQEPDLTLAEIQRRLFEERQQKAGLGSVWRFFDCHGIGFKKSVLAAEEDRRWLDNCQKLKGTIEAICEINHDLLRPEKTAAKRGGRAVIKMRRAQLSFGDGWIAAEVSDRRESWMTHPDPGAGGRTNSSRRV